MTTALSGEQILLQAAGYEATIASVGAGLRSLTFHGRDLVMPYEADEVCPRFRGAILAPWPNRIVDGCYIFHGGEQQLAISEPSRGHALHGLALWLNFDVIEKNESAVSLLGVIQPQTGYPHRIEILVNYSLSEEGLETRVTATNLGVSPAPYGVAPHPYLIAGPGSVDDWTLTASVSSYLEALGERLLPGEILSIGEGDEFDFSSGKVVGDLFIDHAFTGAVFSNEKASVTLMSPAGTGVQMTWGPELPWLQLHTADLPGHSLSRRSLAVEPMTCPPNAFNSGIDLVTLQGHSSHTASWAITSV